MTAAGTDTRALALSQARLQGGFLTDEEYARVFRLAAASLAPATLDAYSRDWRHWERWCAGRRMPPLPASPAHAAFYAELAALYTEEHAALRKPDGSPVYATATLSRRVAALSALFTAAGLPPPGQASLVRKVLAGVRRSRRGIRQRKAGPLLIEDLRAVCAVIADSATTWGKRVTARRDTALLTAAVAGAYRRGELSAHQMRDVTWHRGSGLHMYVAASKTDQEGTGLVKVLPPGEDPLICPPCAVLKWINVVRAWEAHGQAGLIRLLLHPGAGGHICGEAPDVPASQAPLFRRVDRTGVLLDGGLSGHAVNEIFRRRCAHAGLDAGRLWTSHSARAGFITGAFDAGADPTEIARQTGHTSPAVLAGYRRHNTPLHGNAVRRLKF